MRVSTLSSFRATAKTKSLLVAALFVVANMMATLGVFVPSASAALVWEDIVVADGPVGNTRTSGAVPKGSGLDLYTLSSANLSAYSNFKLSFDYENSNQSVGSINLSYWPYQIHQNGDSIGSATNFRSAESVSASSGHVEATFSTSVPSTNRLRLLIDDVNRSTSADPADKLDITNIRFQGQKDDGTVAAPAAPTLSNPANGALIDYDDIQDGTTRLQFDPKEGAVRNHVHISGTFYNQQQNIESPYVNNFHAAGAQTSIALNAFASENSSSWNFIAGKTYTWRVRSSALSDAPYVTGQGAIITDNWGAWSEERQFTVTGEGVVVTPVAPTLVSPEDGALIDYDDIHNSTAKIEFTPVDDVQANHVQVSGLFKDSAGTEVLYTYNGLSAGELTYATAAGGAIRDFIVGETYMWRVRSSFANTPINELGSPDWGAWSEERSFSVVDGTIVLDAPLLTSPVDGATLTGETQKLSWEAPEDADSYEIYVARDASFQDFHTRAGAVETSFDTTNLVAGQTYYWRVRAFNRDTDAKSLWSEVRSFTITAPTVPQNPDPTPGSGGGEGDETNTDNPGETPKTTSTPTGNGVQLASTAQGGEVLAQQDSTGTLSDSTGEDLDDEEQAEEATDEDESEDEPFLLLGWWWLPLLIAAGGGAYYFFKTPSEE